MNASLIAFLFATLVGAQHSHDKEWLEFKKTYGKSYANASEETNRFNIFKKAFEYIDAENAKEHTYTLAINRFSDVETADFVKSHMGFKPPAPSQLWEGLAYLGNHTWAGEELPKSIDWSTKGVVTAVKDQGDCGSCWIFSGIGALEGAFKLARGKLVSLAEQQVLDCSWSILPPTMGCTGGSVGPVFNYAEGHTVCTEASYPYTSGRSAEVGKCELSHCVEGIPKGAVTGWKGLAPVAKIIPSSENSMLSAVAQQPVSVSIEADQDVFHYYKSGVVTGRCGQMPDHAVLVVGYGTDAKLGDYWKVKNSWGADWGEAGYVRIARGVTWRGECAILNSPSYPIVSKLSSEVVV